MVIAGMATIPGREEAFRDAHESLRGQVDMIGWHQNVDGDDFGDAAKFLTLLHHDCDVFLSCDDDLIYPPDYVETVLRALERYPGAIVSFHGAIMPDGWERYYRDRIGFACLGEVVEDVAVHVPGSGVMAFQPSEVDLDVDALLAAPKNMADINVAVQAHLKDIPIFCIAHSAGWIRHSEKVDLQDTIWAKAHKNDQIQSERLKSVELKRWEAE